MNRPKDSQKPTKADSQKAAKPVPQEKAAPDEPEYNLHNLYLILYNWVSAVLWTAVLGRVVLALIIDGYPGVYARVGWLAKWTQSLAALEITHSAIKIVRAPVLTTGLQVLSRFILVWMIVDKFPELATNLAYTTMLLAWSITEVIRYSYFVATLAYGGAPDWLKWLRYNTFVVLYPMGIASEVCMIYLAIPFAKSVHRFFAQSLWAVLAFYPPGAWILFTHMLAQRRKVMKGTVKTKTK